MMSVAVGMSEKSGAAKESSPRALKEAYALFLLGAAAVYHFVANGEFSAILTMSVMFQCLAVALLALQSVASGTAAGISALSLKLEALALVCRLSSTTWLNGYLPVDASGDFIFQAVDICSLVLTGWLIYRLLVVQKDTYQASDDTLPVVGPVAACFVLAALLHADLNDRPLFDALWMAGLFIGVIAVLPQLWMITRNDGHISALTSHHIAAMAISRLLSGTFMWYAREDILCEPWIEGFNHGSWAILAAHFVHLVLLADFAFYYIKSVFSQGLACSVEVGLAQCV
jgi:hypothetical protein